MAVLVTMSTGLIVSAITGESTSTNTYSEMESEQSVIRRIVNTVGFVLF